MQTRSGNALGRLGRFTRRIVDGAQGIPEPATIRGRLSGSQISFSKLYVSVELGQLKRRDSKRLHCGLYVALAVLNSVSANWGNSHAFNRDHLYYDAKLFACNESRCIQLSVLPYRLAFVLGKIANNPVNCV